jgi:hypothetical protein
MADFYWVAGTGNWSDYTNHWRVGGTGGTTPANAPTSADNVFFVDASAAGTFTVTVDGASNCANFDASGITNAARKMTLAGAAALNVYGSWTNPTSTYYAATYTGNITFAATSTGQTITTNAVTMTTGNVTFDGVGGGWTLGGALTIGTTTGILTVTNGAFSTGNYNVTAVTFASSNSNTRTVTLSTSGTANTPTITLSGAAAWTFTTITGLTLNAGNSLISCSNASATFAGGGATYNNVTFTSSGAGTFTLSGTNTFADLTFTSRAAAGLRVINVGANFTVSGTLTLGTANTGIRRIAVISSAIGTQRTITVSGTVAALSDVDFRDIKAAGTVPWTGTRLGNALGNDTSTITFPAGTNKYWYTAAGTGGNWGSASWESTAGGTTPSSDNFPLPQDTAIVQQTGLNDGATITLDSGWYIGSLDFSARSSASYDMVFATGTAAPSIYGSITFGSNVTTTGTGILIFVGQGVTQNIDVANATFDTPFSLSLNTGTFRLVSNLTTGATRTITLNSGTIDLNDKTFTAGLFSSSASVTRGVTFGTTGKFTLTGTSTAGNATIWGVANATSFSVSGTPTVELTGTSTANTRTIQHGSTSGGTEANSISINISAGSDTIATTATSYIKNLIFSGTFTGTLTNTARNIYGDLTFKTGMTLTSGTSATTFAATSGTQTFTSAQTIDFPITVNAPGATVTLADNLTLGSTRAFTLSGGTWNVNAKTASIGSFASTGSTTRAITFGTSGVITVAGAGASAWVASGSGLTTTGTTAKISMTSASAKTFAGGGFNYAATLSQDGAGTLTISGDNTFADITNTVQPTTLTFTAGSTQTVSAFTASGTLGNLVTLQSSSTGSAFYMVDSSGTNSVSYCSLSDSHVSGGATWDAYLTNGNVNGGSNNGWNFAIPVVASASSDISLRSLAQNKRF